MCLSVCLPDADMVSLYVEIKVYCFAQNRADLYKKEFLINASFNSYGIIY